MDEVYFKNIRKILINEIKLAKANLKIAVAWFTNRNLFDLLCAKIKQGLDVELIIIDDFINNGEFGLPFHQFIAMGGKLRYGKYTNPMHHKFVIIDNNTVISGSYNWTYFAESINEENITLIRSNKEIVNSFTIEFNRLADELPLIKNAIKRTFDEIYHDYHMSLKNYLGYDIYYDGLENEDPSKIETSARLLPNNSFLQEEKRKHSSIDVRKKTITRLGIRSRFNNIDDCFSIIIDRDQLVPFNNSRKYRTVEDNQTSIEVKVFRGEDKYCRNNEKIGEFLISGLPEKPAGVASIEVEFDLSENGVLSVTATNNQNGSSVQAIYYVEELVF